MENFQELAGEESPTGGWLPHFPIAKEVHPIPAVAVKRGDKGGIAETRPAVRPVAIGVLRPLHIRGAAQHDGSVFAVDKYIYMRTVYQCEARHSATAANSGAKDVTTSLILETRGTADQPMRCGQIISRRHKRELCTSPPQRVVCFRERGNFASLLSVSTSRTHDRRNQNSE